jgi:hypothetical protein
VFAHTAVFVHKCMKIANAAAKLLPGNKLDEVESWIVITITTTGQEEQNRALLFRGSRVKHDSRKRHVVSTTVSARGNKLFIANNRSNITRLVGQAENDSTTSAKKYDNYMFLGPSLPCLFLLCFAYF